MASKLYNLARMTVASAPGAGTITLNAAVPGFLTFAQAGVANGAFVRYGAKDGNAREVGYATFSSAGNGSLSSRVIENSTSGGAALNLSANAIVSILPSATDFGMIAPHCGRLVYGSSSTIAFVPKNGNKIKIAGGIFEIPVGGLPGLGLSNVVINGVGGQTLAANTSYLVTSFLSAGVPTGGYTTNLGHAPSNNFDNEGVEISSGMGNGHTVLGMCRTGGGAQFLSGFVISWFHKQPVTSFVNWGNASTVDTVNWQPMTNAHEYLCWANDAVTCLWSSQSNTTGSYGGLANYVDGAVAGSTYVYGPMNPVPVSLLCWAVTGDGYHQLIGKSVAASGSGTVSCNNQFTQVVFQG